MINYYDLKYMLSYLEAKTLTNTTDILKLSEPERTIALYCYLKDNDRGTAWENVLLLEYPFLKRINSQEGKGDLRNEHEACIEFKVSYSDKKNDYSFWQCRPWEPTAGYFFKCIDRAEGWKHYNYFLTKKEFLKELSVYGNLDLTHGRKADLPGKLTVETAIEWKKELTVRLKSKGKYLERTNHWKKEYLIDDVASKLKNVKGNII